MWLAGAVALGGAILRELVNVCAHALPNGAESPLRIVIRRVAPSRAPIAASHRHGHHRSAHLAIAKQD